MSAFGLFVAGRGCLPGATGPSRAVLTPRGHRAGTMLAPIDKDC